MKITSIGVDAWSIGRIMVSLENNDSVHINLTEDESERFRQLASDIFFARQKSIAKEIETARPQLIELQSEPTEPTYTPSPEVDGGVPF